MQHEAHVAQRRGIGRHGRLLGDSEAERVRAASAGGASLRRRRRMGEQPLEGSAGALLGAGVAQEARVVVKRKDEAVDLEQQLAGVGVGAQVAFVDGGADGALERVLPGLHHRHERVAHRAGAVVELDRAADVDAAGVDLDRDAAHPAVEQRAQPRQAARRASSTGGRPRPRTCAWYSRTTEICSSSREPKWAKTPDLLMPVTSARAPIESPSRPMCDASASAASRMAARVCWPFMSGRAGAGSAEPSARVSSALTSESTCSLGEPRNRTIVLFCRKDASRPWVAATNRADL